MLGFERRCRWAGQPVSTGDQCGVNRGRCIVGSVSDGM